MNGVYDPLKTQIEKGYLSISFIIGDLYLRVKSPDYNDMEWVEEVSPRLKWKRDLALVSRCLISINGVRLENPFVTMGVLESVSTNLFRRIYFYTLFLIEESKKAYEFLEAFCYEDESRSLWSTWKANQRFGYRPVSNIDNLSYLQTSWVIWNTNEDERIKSREMWDQTLFGASAFNSNVSKIKNKWEEADRDEKANREEVKRQARAGKPKKVEKVKKTRGGIVKKTEHDLRDEFKRWCAGEEDEHDKIVREYKDYIRNKVRESEIRSEEIRERAIERRREMDGVRSNPIVGLTDEQVLELQSRNSSHNLVEMGDSSSLRDHISSKYLFAKEEKGKLKLENGEIVKDKSSIMDSIANRKPHLD